MVRRASVAVSAVGLLLFAAYGLAHLRAPTRPRYVPTRAAGDVHRTYAWQRCDRRGERCQRIRGATGAHYRPTKRDIGHTLRLLIMVRTGKRSETLLSRPTLVVRPAKPVNRSLPTISGLTRQGMTLTARPGTWRHAVRYTYRWEDCDASGRHCSAISNATAKTHKLRASDVGHTIRVVVTGH